MVGRRRRESPRGGKEVSTFERRNRRRQPWEEEEKAGSVERTSGTEVLEIRRLVLWPQRKDFWNEKRGIIPVTGEGKRAGREKEPNRKQPVSQAAILPYPIKRSF